MTDTDKQMNIKRKKTKKSNNVVSAGPLDAEYLYYPLDVEGITLKAHFCQLVQVKTNKNHNKNKNFHQRNFNMPVIILLLVLNKKKNPQKT